MPSIRLAPALYRLALDRAGSRQALSALVDRLLSQYVASQETGAQGGRLSASRMTPEQLSARGRLGGLARAAQRQTPV